MININLFLKVEVAEVGFQDPVVAVEVVVIKAVVAVEEEGLIKSKANQH